MIEIREKDSRPDNTKGLFYRNENKIDCRNKYVKNKHYTVRNEVLKLLFKLGIKLHSLSTIKTHDVDLNEMSIKWKTTISSKRTKNTKIDNIEIQQKIKYLINNPLHLNSPYLFQSRKERGDRPMSRTQIYRILDKFKFRKKNYRKSIDFDKYKNTSAYGVYFAKQASKRKIEFNLKDSEIEEIIFKNCFYCNAKPDQTSVFGEKTNGIDRIDNNLGYFFENVVPCCGTCNRMKSGHNLYFFLDKIKLIYNNRIKEAI